MNRQVLTLIAIGPFFWGLNPGPSQDAKLGEIKSVLDDWHRAAAEADEARYFGHFSTQAIFLGTDAKERWDVAAFRKFAKPYFDKGKAWTFKSVRRDVMLSQDGRLAWFDEDLATGSLGPCRGSGVLQLESGKWKIVHYNLAVTIPNEAMDKVKKVVADGSEP